MSDKAMKTLTMCGSMRFAKEMAETAFILETEHSFNILQCTYDTQNLPLSVEEIKAVTAAHYRKIDLSDGIFVMDIGGYTGRSTADEIRYAQSRNKEIYYYSEFIKQKNRL